MIKFVWVLEFFMCQNLYSDWVILIITHSQSPLKTRQEVKHLKLSKLATTITVSITPSSLNKLTVGSIQAIWDQFAINRFSFLHSSQVAVPLSSWCVSNYEIYQLLKGNSWLGTVLSWRFHFNPHNYSVNLAKISSKYHYIVACYSVFTSPQCCNQ